MKFFHLLGVMSVVSLYGCSNSGEPTPDPDMGNGSATVYLSVNPAAASREIRDLGSEEALDNVKKLNVCVYEGATSDVTSLVVDGGASAPHTIVVDDASPDGAKLDLKGLKAGTVYTVIAYGYNDADGAEVFPADLEADGSGGFSAKWNAVVAEQPSVATVHPEAAGHKNSSVCEFFAGQASFRTDGSGNCDDVIGVVLHRQVAGLLVYVSGIPATAGPEAKTPSSLQIRGYSSGNNTFTFPADVAKMKEGLCTAPSSKAVPEGTVLLKYPLAQANKQNGGTLFAFDAQQSSPATVANSILMGRFLAPYEESGDRTLSLCLCDADDNILRSWEIKFGGKVKFNINNNTLYCIGRKPSASSTDADAPVDLSDSSVSEVTLTIDNSWSVLSNLEVVQQ